MFNVTDTDGHHSQELDLIPLIEIHWEDVQSPVMVCIVIIVAALAKIFFHVAHDFTAKVPECCLLICLGLILGEIVYSVSDHHLADYVFTPSVFFTYILPPIMLEAGYFLPKRAFFDNIGTILTYAVIGTIFNALAIGYSLYGAYLIGLLDGIDDGMEKPLGVIECLLI